MTKETHEPSFDGDNKNAPRPTLFSDGSTFDYVNGYRSNGASVATRDRTELPTIVQTGAMMSTNSFANLIITVILLAVLSTFAWIGLSAFHLQANEKTVIETLNVTGQAEVLGNDIQSNGGVNTVVLRDLTDQNTYRCEVVTIMDPTAKALVFCAPGAPANFSIPVPYDPSNIFYLTPKQDN